MTRKLALAVTAVAAWVLPGHLSLLAILAAIAISAMTTTNTAKARATEQRVNGTVAMVGALRSQQGTTSAFTDSASNLPSPSTSDPNVDSTVVYTSGVQNPSGTVNQHTHSYGHTHTTGMDSYFDAFVSEYNTTLSKLNQMRNALIAAGIL